MCELKVEQRASIVSLHLSIVSLHLMTLDGSALFAAPKRIYLWELHTTHYIYCGRLYHIRWQKRQHNVKLSHLVLHDSGPKVAPQQICDLKVSTKQFARSYDSCGSLVKSRAEANHFLETP